MRVVLTGASSFTGFWFARALASWGVEVVAPLSGSEIAYAGIRGSRVRLLKACCDVSFEAPFGSHAFMARIETLSIVDVFCHHWSQVRNYRHPEFDALAALADNTSGLIDLLRLLKRKHCGAFVLTGSIGEQREGVGEDRRAFSPYGLSKGLTSDFVEHHCGVEGVQFGKFVIPNPFGPYEDQRFTHYLMRIWSTGDVAEVRTGNYLRDNIPADLLADAYASFVTKHAEARRRFAPGCYQETQGEFARRVAREVRARTAWACDLRFPQQTDFSEPMARINPDRAVDLAAGWNEAASWDGFVDYYLESLKGVRASARS